jgi:hypothetical protein
VIGRERNRLRSEVCGKRAGRRLEEESRVPNGVKVWLMETAARVTEIVGSCATVLVLALGKGRAAKTKVPVYGFLEEKSAC